MHKRKIFIYIYLALFNVNLKNIKYAVINLNNFLKKRVISTLSVVLVLKNETPHKDRHETPVRSKQCMLHCKCVLFLHA